MNVTSMKGDCSLFSKLFKSKLIESHQRRSFGWARAKWPRHIHAEQRALRAPRPRHPGQYNADAHGECGGHTTAPLPPPLFVHESA